MQSGSNSAFPVWSAVSILGQRHVNMQPCTYGNKSRPEVSNIRSREQHLWFRLSWSVLPAHTKQPSGEPDNSTLQPFIYILLTTAYHLGQHPLLLLNRATLLVPRLWKQRRRGVMSREGGELKENSKWALTSSDSSALQRLKGCYGVRDEGREASPHHNIVFPLHQIISTLHWLGVALASPRYSSVIWGESRHSLWEDSLYTFDWSPCKGLLRPEVLEASSIKT